MSKSDLIYVCQSCGKSYQKWQGRCEGCGEWNTLAEEVKKEEMEGSGGKRGKMRSSAKLKDTDLSEFLVSFEDSLTGAKMSRFSTGISELDRVLGSDQSGEGMVKGSVMLIGGEPGIGKSTLLSEVLIRVGTSQISDFDSSGRSRTARPKKIDAQCASSTSALNFCPQQSNSSNLEGSITGVEQKNYSKMKILYVAGEESPNQIGLRLQRMINPSPISDFDSSGRSWSRIERQTFLSRDSLISERSSSKETSVANNSASNSLLQKTSAANNFFGKISFCTTTDVDEVAELIEREKPNLLIVDSIQTLTTRDLLGPAGSLGQVRESAERITVAAKKNGVAVFMVGHVNKDGEIAGPKTLEHIVDGVLELSGERGEEWRFLRAVKNRFGATDEVGVFRMTEGGMEEVTNPSGLFLEEMVEKTAGTGVVVTMEGTRPLLIQVQALVVDSQLAMPRRVGRGVDLAKIQVLCAVLQKQLRIPLGMNDVFLSVVGGMNVRESAIELGLAMVLLSSQVNKPLPEKTVFIGEVGLMGEIRKVSNLERRIKEAKRLGYERVYSRMTHKNIRDLAKELRLLA